MQEQLLLFLNHLPNFVTPHHIERRFILPLHTTTILNISEIIEKRRTLRHILYIT